MEVVHCQRGSSRSFTSWPRAVDVTQAEEEKHPSAVEMSSRVADMLRFLLLTVLAAAVLAEPELEPLLEVGAALDPELEPVLELEPEPEPELEPVSELELEPEPEPVSELKEDLVYLEKRPESVVGGTVAKPNSWPWQVSLQAKHKYGYSHICGGSLIRRHWVMTAAHCVDSQQERRVVLGEHDLRRTSGLEQNIAVRRVYIHPRWNMSLLSTGYDIALLRLSKHATLNKYVGLASLPRRGQVLPNGNKCYITGWGCTSNSGGSTTLLKQALLPVVDYKTCSSGDWWGSNVNRNMVCGGGGAEAGCNGDSGGPLNCLVSGKYYVHGIASFVSGRGCSTPKRPTVFSRVSAYISWMNKIMFTRRQ